MPNKCEFVKKENTDDLYVCSKCGFSVRNANSNIHRMCGPRVMEAASAAMKFVSSGLKLVSKEEVERRLDICKACPQFADNVCKLCGCGLKLKAAIESSKCPIEKW